MRSTKNNHYSIEFAHIYTDEKLNGNHFASADLHLEITQITHPDSSSIVLIDNYNAEDRNFSLERYLSELESYGAKPDFYAFEADLLPVADKLLSSIEKPKILRMYKSYIERKGKYPCSLLTAAWYLLRLGHIQQEGVIKPNNPRINLDAAVGDKLINIIPKTFMRVEKEAHALISHSIFKDARYKIQPILFEEKHPVRNSSFIPETVG